MVMSTSNEICPFVRKPFSNCHCFNMTSRNIDSAIHYCVNQFKACEIFRFESRKDMSFKDSKTGLTRSCEGN